MPASRPCLIGEVTFPSRCCELRLLLPVKLWYSTRGIVGKLSVDRAFPGKGIWVKKKRINFNKYETELSSCIKAFLTNFICDLSAVTPHELAAKWKAPPYLGHKRTVCQHIAQYEATRSQSGEGDRKTMKTLNRGTDQEKDLDTTRKGGRGKEMHANTQEKGIRFLPSDVSKIEWQNSSLLFLLYPSFIIPPHQSWLFLGGDNFSGTATAPRRTEVELRPHIPPELIRAFYSCVFWPVLFCWPQLHVYKPRRPSMTTDTPTSIYKMYWEVNCTV